MASVIITFKVMPDSPEDDLEKIQEDTTQLITEFGGNVGKVDKDPIGFGLVALKIMFVMSEELGSTDELEEKIAALPSVGNVDVIDVRRTLG